MKHDDDFLLPPPPLAPDSGFGEFSKLDTDELSKYPPLIPVPGASDTSIGGMKSILSYSIELIAIVKKSYKREERFSSDVYDQLSDKHQERHADHGATNQPFAAITPPETFHLQPRADVIPEAPAIVGGTSGLVVRDQVYQQAPTSSVVGSQLLLLPVLVLLFKSLWETLEGRSSGNVGRLHKRAIRQGARRQHARSWSASHDDLTQESLD